MNDTYRATYQHLEDKDTQSPPIHSARMATPTYHLRGNVLYKHQWL